MTIKFYRASGPYGYLSNFHSAIVVIDGLQWPTNEHYYQAYKSTDPDVMDRIRTCESPGDAWHLGQGIEIREDWNDIVGEAPLWQLFTDDQGIVVHTVKDHIMYAGLIQKFEQHKVLAQALLATGDEPLIEDAKRDRYWGCGKDGTGQNKLGRMLAMIRKIMRTRQAGT